MVWDSKKAIGVFESLSKGLALKSD